MRRKIVAGNWKMNKTNTEAVKTVAELKTLVAGKNGAEIVVAVPFTAISDVANELKGSNVELLTTEIENSLDVYFPNLNLLGLINTIGKTYAIPENKIEYEVAENVDKKMPITLENKSFRKLSSLDF